MPPPLENNPSLLATFENLADSTKQALADIDSPLLLGLATLVLSQDQAKRNYLSAEHIVAALEAAGVAVEKKQISKSFSRAGDRISRQIIDEEIQYKVMTKGRREAEPLLRAGTIGVSFIEAAQPRAARKTLSDMFSTLSGDIRICDPYYGLRSLDALEMIPSACKVRFLTAQTNEKPHTLSGPISDFKRERPHTEMRLFPNPRQIHDRYLLSSKNLFLLGHGIKDIGNKESFVVNVSTDYARDLVTQLSSSFDDKWSKSTPL